MTYRDDLDHVCDFVHDLVWAPGGPFSFEEVGEARAAADRLRAQEASFKDLLGEQRKLCVDEHSNTRTANGRDVASWLVANPTELEANLWAEVVAAMPEATKDRIIEEAQREPSVKTMVRVFRMAKDESEKNQREVMISTLNKSVEEAIVKLGLSEPQLFRSAFEKRVPEAMTFVEGFAVDARKNYDEQLAKYESGQISFSELCKVQAESAGDFGRTHGPDIMDKLSEVIASAYAEYLSQLPVVQEVGENG